MTRKHWYCLAFAGDQGRYAAYQGFLQKDHIRKCDIDRSKMQLGLSDGSNPPDNEIKFDLHELHDSSKTL